MLYMLLPLKVFISLCTEASSSHGQLLVLLDLFAAGLWDNFGKFWFIQHQGLVSVVGGCEKEEGQRKGLVVWQQNQVWIRGSRG